MTIAKINFYFNENNEYEIGVVNKRREYIFIIGYDNRPFNIIKDEFQEALEIAEEYTDMSKVRNCYRFIEEGLLIRKAADMLGWQFKYSYSV